jgi:predicted GNAT family acetyltransferase
MMVQFTNFRVREYVDMVEFSAKLGRWLTFREAENSYLLVELSNLLANPTTHKNARAFVVQENEAFVAVGILFESGCMLMTWTPAEAMSAIIDHLVAGRWAISSVYAPGHVSWTFAQGWAERTNQRVEMDRAERIYQLARSSYPLPTDGRLEIASNADRSILQQWTEAFIKEAQFETGERTAAQLLQTLMDSRSLFVWKTTTAVSMAASVAPTPHGSAINFVYTPPEYRRRGYAKAVVAALAAHLLASNRKYCFIFADTDDHLKHKLYQQVGARTLCEFVRCKFHANAPVSAINFAAPVSSPNFSYVLAG